MVRGSVMQSEYLSDDGELEWLAGDVRLDDSPRSDVLLALRTPRGGCPLDPTFGDRTYEIEKVTRAARRLAESFTREALAHLVASKRIRDLDVSADIVGRALVRRVSYRVGAKREAVELRTTIGG